MSATIDFPQRIDVIQRKERHQFGDDHVALLMMFVIDPTKQRGAVNAQIAGSFSTVLFQPAFFQQVAKASAHRDHVICFFDSQQVTDALNTQMLNTQQDHPAQRRAFLLVNPTLHFWPTNSDQGCDLGRVVGMFIIEATDNNEVNDVIRQVRHRIEIIRILLQSRTNMKKLAIRATFLLTLGLKCLLQRGAQWKTVPIISSSIHKQAYYDIMKCNIKVIDQGGGCKR